ncbi:hypothetical protein ACJRO7_029990 [Eucalyptus globulus]|uniref:cyclin-dependent kinase n=1 Tax=Eucalyptus globulus TaxID=34317 RepID=A0ABD3JA96_EUCGL
MKHGIVVFSKWMDYATIKQQRRPDVHPTENKEDLDLKKHMDSSPDFAKDSRPVKAIFLMRIFLCQILRGIPHCHLHGVLHPDLKPQNLLIDRCKNALKLANFALAMAFGIPVRTFTHHRAPGILPGSSHYSTPIDVRSVGWMFAEMMNQRPLFPGDSEINELFKYSVTAFSDFKSAFLRWPLKGTFYAELLNIQDVVPGLDAAGIDLLSVIRCTIHLNLVLMHNYHQSPGYFTKRIGKLKI